MNRQKAPLTDEGKRHRRKLWKNLTTNENLRRFRRQVRGIINDRRRKSKSRFTFGMVLDLLPIRKDFDAVANYFEENFKETSRREELARNERWRSGTVSKGMRLVAYGRAFPKPLPDPVTRGYIRYVEKIDVFVRALRTPREFFYARFGKRFWYSYFA